MVAAAIWLIWYMKSKSKETFKSYRNTIQIVVTNPTIIRAKGGDQIKWEEKKSNKQTTWNGLRWKPLIFKTFEINSNHLSWDV